LIEYAKVIFSKGKLLHIVCTKGKDGVSWFHKNEKGEIVEELFNAIPVEESKIVSVIGAGDSFNAGFIASLTKNYYMPELERFRKAINVGLHCSSFSIQSTENISPLFSEKLLE
jgi:sugar/nucleoside kinase (ribokinase family)